MCPGTKVFPDNTLYTIALHSRAHLFFSDYKSDARTAQGVPGSKERKGMAGGFSVNLVKNNLEVSGAKQPLVPCEFLHRPPQLLRTSVRMSIRRKAACDLWHDDD